MSDLAAIAREYLEAVPRRDFDTCRRLLHPQYSHTGDGRRMEGVDVGIAVADMWTTVFPDMKLEISETHVTGDVVIVEFVVGGTHRGELMGIAPTGRHISLPVCTVLEIRDGKVYAERAYMNMMHMMEQLGVAPTPATV